jgi:hypothetical protein
MEYTSLTWNDVRFHNDRLREFSYPLSRTFHEWTLICYFICLRSWLVTMCDIWPVAGISSIINATCGTGYYLTSWAFRSNSSFMGTCCSNFSFLMWTIVCLLFPLSLWPLSFRMLLLVTHMLTSDFPYNYWLKIKHVNIINKWLKD